MKIDIIYPKDQCFTDSLFLDQEKLMKLLGLFFVTGVILSASLDPHETRGRVSKCCEAEEVFNLESMICTDSQVQVMKF